MAAGPGQDPAAGLEGVETLVTDAVVAEAIDAWNAWETAVGRSERWSTPMQRRVNGRRWAEPGE